MGTFIALLRGINVGGHNQLPMATLREHLTALGYRDVVTYIQSGNVILESDEDDPTEITSTIEASLAADLGLDVAVIIRTPDEVAAAATASPYLAHPDRSRIFIAFLAASPEPAAVDATDPHIFAPDTSAVVGREVHVHCPSGLGRSKLSNAWLEKQLGVRSTMRNLNTIDRILAIAEER
jgi:uncharacterized protein (DUF1697 family)